MDGPSDQCEVNPGMGTPLRRTDRVISVSRRRELLNLAEAVSDWIIQHDIKPSELCFFRQAVQMLTDTRD